MLISRRDLVPFLLVLALEAPATAAASDLSDSLRLDEDKETASRPPFVLFPSLDPVDDGVSTLLPPERMPMPIANGVTMALTRARLRHESANRRVLAAAGVNLGWYLVSPLRRSGEQRLRQLVDDHPWMAGLVLFGAMAAAGAILDHSASQRRPLCVSKAFRLGPVQLLAFAAHDFRTGQNQAELRIDLGAVADKPGLLNW